MLKRSHLQTKKLTRRSMVLRSLRAAACMSILSPLTGFAAVLPANTLVFSHTHTGETLELSYSPVKGITPGTRNKINHFLRDFRTGEVSPIDLKLFDQLCHIQHISGCKGTIEIISGYRSPATNDKLRKQGGGGVARKSLHMKGQAIDIRIAGLDTENLRDVACSLKCGGVGYYPKSDFVHLDTGRVRFW